MLRALFIRGLFGALALLFCAHGSRAQMEQILDFHSDITVQQDSSLQVTETISVIATGNQIRHGIYREFPTTYRDAFNDKHTVNFQMLAATRDSADERFRVEDYANGKRVYLGDANTIVPRGRHVYTITYVTNRQLGFFKDHDELFWNVTGNGWGFRIDHASASVHLPSTIPGNQITLTGFTGVQGSRQSDVTTATDVEDGTLQFSSSRPFQPKEGLTILLSWPKGYFAEPTFSEKVANFFQDNRDALFLAGTWLTMLLYYVIAWSAVGRDPQRGVVMALYEPPPNLSPAGMRYLLRMGYDNKTFAAAILDMAVRGYLTIREEGHSYTLYVTGKGESALTPDERQVAQMLFSGRNELWLNHENHVTIKDAITTLKQWLAAAEQKTYFVTNSRYLIPPVSFSVVIAVAYLVARGVPQIFAGAFLSIWLSVWTLAVGGMVYTIGKMWRAIFAPHTSALGEVAETGKAILFTAFCIPFLLGEVMGLFFLLKMTSLPFVLFIFTSGALHFLFLYLMKAPTFAGRRLMDQVEGFKMFLGAVDGDRLNRAAPPQQTPAVFERFLPYALALDVEQDWANKFSTVLAGAGSAPGTTQSGYTPSFYSGSSWNGNGFGGTSFASAFSSSFTSAISSSSTAPGSGSGGGGGGSGGGGGGGGGGGW